MISGRSEEAITRFATGLLLASVTLASQARGQDAKIDGEGYSMTAGSFSLTGPYQPEPLDYSLEELLDAMSPFVSDSEMQTAEAMLLGPTPSVAVHKLYDRILTSSGTHDRDTILVDTSLPVLVCGTVLFHELDHVIEALIHRQPQDPTTQGPCGGEPHIAKHSAQAAGFVAALSSGGPTEEQAAEICEALAAHVKAAQAHGLALFTSCDDPGSVANGLFLLADLMGDFCALCGGCEVCGC